MNVGAKPSAKIYRVEFYEEAGASPVYRWLTEELPPTLRRALTAALEEVLAKQGINVCSTEFGNNLGGGIFEFRLRHDAEEIYRRAGRPFISGSERSSKILLRVFCQAYGNRIVLLLAGYDKAANSRPRHQQQQIALAQKRLRRWVALRKGRS